VTVDDGDAGTRIGRVVSEGVDADGCHVDWVAVPGAGVRFGTLCEVGDTDSAVYDTNAAAAAGELTVIDTATGAARFVTRKARS
jgi:hypothetical protein